MPECFHLPFRSVSHRLRYRHRCGHIREYRAGSEWPAHRPCFDCYEQLCSWVSRSIAPHIRTTTGRYSVAQFIGQILEQEYLRSAERNPEDTGEIRLFEVRKAG